jgi:hypothetical protein
MTVENTESTEATNAGDSGSETTATTTDTTTTTAADTGDKGGEGEGGESTETKSEGLLTGKGQGQTTEQGNGAELEITLPEGVTVDENMLEGFKPIAAEIGLDSEKASKLAGWYAEQRAAEQQALTDSHKAQGAQWTEDLRADPDVGGQKFEASVAAARSAIARFGGEELRAELDLYGLAANPALFRTFVRIGQAIAEDSSHSKQATTPAEKSREERRQARFSHPDSKALME